MNRFVTIIPGTDTKHAIVARVIRTDIKAIYIEPFVDGPILGFDREHGKQWGLWPTEEAARGWHVAQNDLIAFREAHSFVVDLPNEGHKAIKGAETAQIAALARFVDDWLSSHGLPTLVEAHTGKARDWPRLRIGFVVLDPADAEPKETKVIVPPPDKPAAVYCDDGDLDSFMGDGAPVFPADAKADARVYASRVIDAYLREHAQLPLRSWGGALRSICAAIAGLHMLVAQSVVPVPTRIWLAYADALRMLRRCATGDMHLMLEGADGKRFPDIKPSAAPPADLAAEMEAELRRMAEDGAAPRMLFKVLVPQGVDIDVDKLARSLGVVLTRVSPESLRSA